VVLRPNLLGKLLEYGVEPHAHGRADAIDRVLKRVRRMSCLGHGGQA
jgi:hypothetical protein